MRRSIQTTLLFLAMLIPLVGFSESGESNEHLKKESYDNAPMYCHSGIQVSVNELGFAVILPQMLLAEIFPNYDNFIVEIVDPPMFIDTVTCEQVGMTIDVMVTDTTTGNSCWSQVTVEDKLKPVIECDTMILPCIIDPFDLPDSVQPSFLYDNCTPSDSLDLSFSQSTMTLNCMVSPFIYVFKIVRVWTVTDESGNSSSCTQVILFKKGTLDELDFPPDITLSCPVTDISEDVTGEPTIDGQPLESLCMLVYIAEDNVLPHCGNSSLVERKFTAMDWCTGMMKMHTQKIHIVDTIPPTIYCPDNDTINATANCQADYTIPDIIATDECANDSTLVFYYKVNGAFTSNPITGLDTGTHEIKVLVRDPCWNVDSCKYYVTVVDNEPPILFCDSTTVTLDSNGMITISYNYFVGNWYSDNCEIVDTMIRRVDTDCGDPADQIFGDSIKFCCNDADQVIMLAIKVTDSYGNIGICMFNITVLDPFGPVLQCPPDMTVNCNDVDSTDFGTVTVTAGCPFLLDSTIVPLIDDCGRGTIERTYLALSPQGMVVQCTQTITVVNPYDFTNDSLMFPQDTLITACNPDTSTTALGEPVILDNFCGNITVVHNDSIPNPDSACLVIYRIWEVFNACDSLAMFDSIQVIEIKNASPPEITAPPNGTYYVGANCDVQVDLPPVVVGDCSTDITVTNNFNSQGGDIDTILPPGIYPITFTATNACNLSANDLTVITVLDQTPPVIMCPGAVILDCPADTSVGMTGMATATDNCTPPPTITYSDAVTPGACPNTYTVVRTWVAVDAHMNSASCEQNIIVIDNTPPVISCPGSITLNCPADTSPVVTGMATATEECNDPATITYSDVVTPGGCPNTFSIIRTWTATDACNNSASCQQSIIVQDDTDPIISCPGNMTLNCPADTSVGVTGVATATEECNAPPIITYSDSVIAGPCPNTFTVMREWVASDVCGNSSSCTQILNVIDNTNPIISCPGNMTLNCPADTTTAMTGVATATDECNNPPAISYSDAVTPGMCPNTFTVNRTWTATDACNNVSICVQVITVIDNTNPIIVCPGNLTLDCPADTSVAQTGMASATDECNNPPLITYADTVTPGGCPNTFTLNRTWKAEDACGNMATCVQVIIVEDNTQPLISCPANMTLECPADTSVAMTGSATATDECNNPPVITYNDVVIPGGCPNTFTVNRTWTATDACSNTASCVQIITVQDDTDPVIMCPGNETLNCPADTSPANTGIATATEDCNAPAAIAYSDSIVPGNCPNTFTIIRTWSATDSCNNTSTCEQIINVVDDTDPVISCPGNMTLNCPADTSVATTGSATATEECNSPAVITYSDLVILGGCPNTFTVERTWVATDACGNSSSCIQTLLVIDNTNPIISCPGNVTLNCPADTSIAMTGSATATDECNNPPAITYNDVVTPGMCPNTFTVSRTWTALDACGNSASCVQTISVIDNTNPIISCPGNLTLDCPADTSVAQTGIASATDECNNPPLITYADTVTPGGCPNTFTLNRTWKAEDACGNIATCVQVIVVEDNTPPLISCPGNMTLECPADTSVASTGSATATDECNNPPVITYSDMVIPGGCSGTFTINRTWTATDACSNTATCVQIITVQDETDPVISCPVNVTLDCPADTTPAGAGMATATDLCTNATITYSDVVTQGSCPNNFSVVRTWIATDPCGNSDTCTQNIIVQDTTAPVITCPGDVTVNCDADTMPSMTGIPTATDGCNNLGITLTYSDVILPGSGNVLFIIVRTWTATDECGNTDDCDQMIIVLDANAPSLTCPDDITVYLTQDSCQIFVNVPEPDVSDVCGGDVTVTNDGNGDDLLDASGIYPKGITTITYTAEDGVGNDTMCQMTITVLDTISPEIMCPATDSIDCDQNPIPLSQFGTPTFDDNCPGATLIVMDSVFTINDCGVGTIDRIFVVEDAEGNTATCTQTIMVQGNSMLDSLDFTWPVDTVTSYACLDITELPLPLPTVNSNLTTCNPIGIDSTVTAIIPATYGCMTFVVDYIVTDSCNFNANTGAGQWTFSQLVGIFDTIAPVIDSITAAGPFFADSLCMAMITFDLVTANDNCNDVIITNNSPFALDGGADASGTYPGGTTTFTFFATDICGNVDSFDLSVFVADTTPPELVCLKNEYTIQDDGDVNINVDTVITSVTDNCPEIMLTYDLNDLADTIRTYDCDSVGMIFFVWVYAIDASGNVDSCISEIGISDIFGFCDSSSSITIGGNVATSLFDPVTDVQLSMMMNNHMELDMSDIEGDFIFENVPSNVIHRVDAEKSDPYLNGLTAYDLSILFRHIAGIEELTDPYLYYAADVTGDQIIDIRDVLELRKLLLGIQGDLPVSSWTFYDAHYDLDGATNPFYYNVPDHVMVYHNQMDMMDADFIGVKTGDLDYSAETGLIGADERKGLKAQIILGLPEMNQERYALIPVFVDAPGSLQGGQVEIELDSRHVLEAVIPNSDLQLESSEINFNHDGANSVRFVWVAEEEVQDYSKPLCWIKVRKEGELGSSSWSINSTFHNEMFDVAGNKMGAELRFIADEIQSENGDASFALMQNVPNPFDNSTLIQFVLPEKSAFELIIFDTHGARIHSIKGQGASGLNGVEIDEHNLNGKTGLMYYQLSTGNNQAVKKMIIKD